MRKFVTGTLFAAVAVVLTASTAFAATFTVSNPNASGDIFGSLRPGTSAVFRDVNTGQTLTCTESTVSGRLPSGTGLSGIGIADLSFTFGSCTGPLGGTASGTMTGSLNVMSIDPVTGEISGSITGVNASLAVSSILGTCIVTASGSLNSVTFDGSELTIAPDPVPALAITTASGPCAGLLGANDRITFQARYDISPRITITSP